jgi:group I intron endonuclease
MIPPLSLLLQELKEKAGIYCWYNTTTDLFYIGSSVNLRRRIHCYLSLAFLTRHKDSSIINRALLKYGLTSFVLLILETLESGKKEKLINIAASYRR